MLEINPSPQSGETENSESNTGSSQRFVPKVTTARFNLRPHSIVSIEGIEYLVERRLREEWCFLNKETDEPIRKTDAILAMLQANGQFHVVWQQSRKEGITPPEEPLNVGEGANKENLRKLDFVLGCINHPDYCRSRNPLKRIIKDIAERRREDQPKFTTVLNWIDKYELNGAAYGPAALTDRHDLKGRYGNRYTDYQEEAINIGIELWLNRTTAANAYAAVYDSVRKLDEKGTIDKAALAPKFLDEQGRLKPPSRRQFERRCNQVSPAVRDAMRIGAPYARQNYRTYSTTALPDVPYSSVEVDHCTLDIQLLHSSGIRLGRPDLVIFRDKATAMIVGYGLGYEQPSYTSFMDGLRNAIYPKDLSRFPRVKSQWPCWGNIQNLITDRGSHFVGGNIEAAAQQLGINLIPLHAREPWLKGALERFFKSLNDGLLHGLPGTTLSNIYVRRDHDNLGDPVLTIEQFEALLVSWICDEYNARPSKALGHIRGFGGQSPLQAWNAKANSLVSDVLPKKEVFVALAGHTSYRTLQKNGFTVDHIVYEGPSLAPILGNPKHKRKGSHGGATTYRLTRDPHNLGKIYVFNHHTNETITVMATSAHLSYADGLSLTEHEIICANARKMFGDKHDFDELMRAKASLVEFSNQIKSGPKYKTTQRRFAKWLEGDRVREMRSNIMTFQSDGGDYLDLAPIAATPIPVAPLRPEPTQPPLAEIPPKPVSPTKQAKPDAETEDAEFEALRRKKSGIPDMTLNEQSNSASIPPAMRNAGERQMLIKNIFVKHDRFDEASNAIRRTHYPVIGGEPDYGSITVLAGESRAGKSYAARRYMREFPPIMGEGGMSFPVLYADIPIDGQRAMLESMADALALKFSLHVNNHGLATMILKGLKQQKVELLILDEVNTIVYPGNKKGINYALTLFRKILNECRLNIVCIGLEETYDLLAADPQLTGRGGLPCVIIRPYSWESEEEQMLFRLLCDEFDRRLPFTNKSKEPLI
jgi:putative transposase